MFSEKAQQRLEDEIVIWMTTVKESGQPQTSLVWFWWDGSDFLMYSLDPSPRLSNISGNPHVALNLDGDGRGGDVITIEGTAALAPDMPPAHEMPEYLAKYLRHMERGWEGPAAFAAEYPTAVRITPTRVTEYAG